MPNGKPAPKDLNEMLAANGIKGVMAVDASPNPAEPVKPTDTPAKEDGYLGAYLGGDGRYLHSYMIDGRKVILPKKLEEMTDEDFFSLSSTIYDPVANRIPLNLTVKWRDAHWAGYWANRKAQDGKSVRRLASMGFVTAKKEDCEWIPQGLNTEDGEITDGDLVLMKIHKFKLFNGFLAGYFAEALQKGGQESYKKQAEGSLGGPTNKVSHYMSPGATQEFHGLGPIGQPMAR